jgi:hypothetical protein
MGEARRRQLARASTTLPADIKTDIARVVRAVDTADILEDGTINSALGRCMLRQMVGGVVLTYLNIPVRCGWGSLIYRAGPDEMWDVVCYCGPGSGFINSAAMKYITYADEEASFCGHAWLESGDDLIDFRVGDWRQNTEHGIGREYIVGADDGRPANWTAPPLLDFFWDKVAMFKDPWQPEGTPLLGVAWYGPMKCARGRAVF